MKTITITEQAELNRQTAIQAKQQELVQLIAERDRAATHYRAALLDSDISISWLREWERLNDKIRRLKDVALEG